MRPLGRRRAFLQRRPMIGWRVVAEARTARGRGRHQPGTTRREARRLPNQRHALTNAELGEVSGSGHRDDQGHGFAISFIPSVSNCLRCCCSSSTSSPVRKVRDGLVSNRGALFAAIPVAALLTKPIPAVRSGGIGGTAQDGPPAGRSRLWRWRALPAAPDRLNRNGPNTSWRCAPADDRLWQSAASETARASFENERARRPVHASAGPSRRNL